MLVRQSHHGAREEYGLPADWILQDQANDAQWICGVARQVAQLREPAAEPRKRRDLHGDGPVEQHSGLGSVGLIFGPR